MRGISRAEATGGIEPLWHRNKRCPMTHAKRLWSIWQALLSAFAWAFTRPSFRRFAEWITAMAINGEEHTITQSVLALERPADWGSAAGSGTGPILLNWAAPPTSERSSPGRGILISAHLSRATRGTIGRLQAQTFRDFLLPFRLAKGAATLQAAAKRFQFLRVVGLIDPLEPIRRHIDRPRRQQRPLFSRRMTALPQA